MRKVIITHKTTSSSGLTTTNKLNGLCHGIDIARGSVLIELPNGLLVYEPTYAVQFLDKPEDEQLTNMVTTLVAARISRSGVNGSQILIVENAIDFVKEILRHTKP